MDAFDTVTAFSETPRIFGEMFFFFQNYYCYLLSPTRLLQNVRKEQHDQLVVMFSAINEAGSDEWRATLTVAAAAYDESLPPIIEYGPANQTLPYSSIGNLVCRAIGNPQPVITWYKDDSPLSTEIARINITESGTLQIMSEYILGHIGLDNIFEVHLFGLRKSKIKK